MPSQAPAKGGQCPPVASGAAFEGLRNINPGRPGLVGRKDYVEGRGLKGMLKGALFNQMESVAAINLAKKGKGAMYHFAFLRLNAGRRALVFRSSRPASPERRCRRR